MALTQSTGASPRNRFLLGLATATTTLVAPLVLAQSNPQPLPTRSEKQLSFSIVSVKRHKNATNGGGAEGCYVDGCHFVGRPLLAFIMTAYGLSQKYVIGDPLSGDADLFDLDAKIDPADMPATRLSFNELTVMLQSVLAERFRLRVHHETRTLPVYNISIAKGGLKMKESAPPEPANLDGPVSPLRRLYPQVSGQRPACRARLHYQRHNQYPRRSDRPHNH